MNLKYVNVLYLEAGNVYRSVLKQKTQLCSCRKTFSSLVVLFISMRKPKFLTLTNIKHMLYPIGSYKINYIYMHRKLNLKSSLSFQVGNSIIILVKRSS